MSAAAVAQNSPLKLSRGVSVTVFGKLDQTLVESPKKPMRKVAPPKSEQAPVEKRRVSLGKPSVGMSNVLNDSVSEHKELPSPNLSRKAQTLSKASLPVFEESSRRASFTPRHHTDSSMNNVLNHNSTPKSASTKFLKREYSKSLLSPGLTSILTDEVEHKELPSPNQSRRAQTLSKQKVPPSSAPSPLAPSASTFALRSPATRRSCDSSLSFIFGIDNSTELKSPAKKKMSFAGAGGQTSLILG